MASAPELTQDESVYAVGVKRARTVALKAACVELLMQEEREIRLKRTIWWNRSLLKRAPSLSSGTGQWRRGKFYGARSNYTRMHAFPLSPASYYEHFRFTREDIPVLTRALRMPTTIRCGGCVSSGEEALLMYLKRTSFPTRLVDLETFFERSITYISEIVEGVRLHLDPIAVKLLLEFDHDRLERSNLYEVFNAAFERKGCPLADIWSLLDGVFVRFGRPSLDGYRGADQRAEYNGSKKGHGINHQGLLTPDGIFVAMHGPNNGKTNDKKSLRESGLLDRVKKHCIIAGVLYGIFSDSGYTHGDPALQVPVKGPNKTAAEKSYNNTMSKFRVPVEWGFGKIYSLWGYVAYHQNLRLHSQPVASYWRVAALLTNCHSCLYGNQTSVYFGVPTPGLFDYLRNGFY